MKAEDGLIRQGSGFGRRMFFLTTSSCWAVVILTMPAVNLWLVSPVKSLPARASIETS